MPKFKIRQNFSNGSSSSVVIPAANEATALAVGQALMDSELEVLEAPLDITVTDASATNVSYKKVAVVAKHSASGNKTFINFIAKATVSIIDVETFFIGKTINGVSIDAVSVSSKTYTI